MRPLALYQAPPQHLVVAHLQVIGLQKAYDPYVGDEQDDARQDELNNEQDENVDSLECAIGPLFHAIDEIVRGHVLFQRRYAVHVERRRRVDRFTDYTHKRRVIVFVVVVVAAVANVVIIMIIISVNGAFDLYVADGGQLGQKALVEREVVQHRPERLVVELFGKSIEKRWHREKNGHEPNDDYAQQDVLRRELARTRVHDAHPAVHGDHHDREGADEHEHYLYGVRELAPHAAACPAGKEQRQVKRRRAYGEEEHIGQR